ncbi:MAG: hypothetical protein ACXWF9_00190 [Solirubrobacterales bacterium]
MGLIPELAQPDPAVVLRDIAPDPPIRRVWVVTPSAATRSDAVDEMLAILRDVGAAWARERKLQIAS